MLHRAENVLRAGHGASNACESGTGLQSRDASVCTGPGEGRSMLAQGWTALPLHG